MDLSCDLFEAGDFLASIVAWIDALLCEPPILQSQVSRFVEGDYICTA